jgi:hypothetical protein
VPTAAPTGIPQMHRHHHHFHCPQQQTPTITKDDEDGSILSLTQMSK